MCRESSHTGVRPRVEISTWDNSQRSAIRYLMNASLAAGSHGRSWSEECMLAGTFSLFGFRCGQTLTARWNPFSFVARRQRGQGCEQCKGYMEQSYWSIRAHPAGMERSNYHSCLQWTPCEGFTASRLGKVKGFDHAGDWLHASPLTAVGLWLSDEAIRVATCFRLARSYENRTHASVVQ